jgi:hypothetical protein
MENISVPLQRNISIVLTAEGSMSLFCGDVHVGFAPYFQLDEYQRESIIEMANSPEFIQENKSKMDLSILENFINLKIKPSDLQMENVPIVLPPPPPPPQPQPICHGPFCNEGMILSIMDDKIVIYLGEVSPAT